MVDNQHKARALGADDFCVKPIERAWLLDRLQALTKAAPREQVLVIDDNEVSRYLLKELLAGTRFEVLEATNGAEGLRLAVRVRPRAIFLDLDMPGLSGFEVLQGLRSTAATREVPVIIHTARILQEAERAALANQATTLLPKEALSRAMALTCLREALARTGMGDGSLGGAHA